MEKPNEDRFRWLKRLSLSGSVLLLLLVALWVAWDRYSWRVLEREVAAIRVAGEPASVAQLQPAQVAEHENAALLYLEAAAAMVGGVDSPANTAAVFGQDLPYPREWFEMCRKAVETNSKALNLARKATTRPKADWGIDYSSTRSAMASSSWGGQRRLANLLGDAALYEHFSGDDRTAIHDIRALLHQADGIAASPLLIPKLVGTGVGALATYHLQVMAGDLCISARGMPAAEGEVPREEIEQLIRDLLDRPGELPQWLREERAFVISFQQDQEATLSRWVLGPAVRLDEARIIRELGEMVPAATQPTLWKANAALGPRTPQRGLGIPHNLRAVGASSTFRWFTTYHRAAADQRMAAVMLAFRMFTLDHGRYPSRLAELTPTYLPALPVDPLAKDGRTLGYFIASNGKRPIIYSAGENGMDDTGTLPTLPASIYKGWQRPRPNLPDDQYRDLTSWVNPQPRPPVTGLPTTQKAQK